MIILIICFWLFDDYFDDYFDYLVFDYLGYLRIIFIIRKLIIWLIWELFWLFELWLFWLLDAYLPAAACQQVGRQVSFPKAFALHLMYCPGPCREELLISCYLQGLLRIISYLLGIDTPSQAKPAAPSHQQCSAPWGCNTMSGCILIPDYVLLMLMSLSKCPNVPAHLCKQQR